MYVIFKFPQFVLKCVYVFQVVSWNKNILGKSTWPWRKTNVLYDVTEPWTLGDMLSIYVHAQKLLSHIYISCCWRYKHLYYNLSCLINITTGNIQGDLNFNITLKINLTRLFFNWRNRGYANDLRINRSETVLNTWLIYRRVY